jgi:collagenase-like PrtC family protease
MQKFSLPFNPWKHSLREYIPKVIDPFLPYIQSVYYALPGTLSTSARRTEECDTSMITDATEAFAKMGVEPCIVLNGSWNSFAMNRDKHIKLLVSSLKTLHSYGLAGLTVASNLLMNSGVLREIPRLKVQSSVNQFTDSFEKAEMLVKNLGYDGIVWDRNINLLIDRLKQNNQQLKTLYPHASTTIMVNEGCLGMCPFQREHAIHISMMSCQDPEWLEYVKATDAKYPGLTSSYYAQSVSNGCGKLIKDHPELAKDIPFIRSDKIDAYTDCADIIKISGRDQNVDWIANAVRAYVNKTPFKYEYLDAKIIR